MVVYYTSFEASALHSSWEIFDETLTLVYMDRKKELKRNKKDRKSIVSYTIQLVIAVFHSSFKLLACIVPEKSWRKI